jgi:predicted alpha/beta superfamily hydrolase
MREWPTRSVIVQNRGSRIQRSILAWLPALLLMLAATISRAQPDPARGYFVTYPAFHSAHLKADRDIRIWLPPGYDAEKSRRYPVFYLHDAQNLYKGGPSFIPNQAWNADTIAADLIKSKRIQPLILVGIDNAGRDRMAEYTPTEMSRYPGSGKGGHYGSMIVEELKPFIDSHFRTLKDAQNTALGGSSLGGLISLAIALQYPKTFGKLAILSPSVWWDDGVICRRVEKLTDRPQTRLWLDIGTKEGVDAVEPARRLHTVLLSRGWKDGSNLHYVETEGAEHNEKAWAARFPEVMTFLFGRQ